MSWELLGWPAAALIALWLGFAGAMIRRTLLSMEAGEDAPGDYQVSSRLRRLQDDPAGLGLRLRFSRILSAVLVPLGLAMAAKALGPGAMALGAFAGFLISAAAENLGPVMHLFPVAAWAQGTGLGAWTRITAPAARLVPKRRIAQAAHAQGQSLVMTESRASLVPTRLEREERALLRRLLASAAIIVSDIMTRWDRVVTIPVEMDRESALAHIAKAGHSRLPVVQDGAVLGLITAKAILTGSAPVMGVMNPVWFLRDDMIVQNALDEMREARTHLAVVLDRFGRPVGIITIEDILEEIVGELYDEREAPQ